MRFSGPHVARHRLRFIHRIEFDAREGALHRSLTSCPTTSTDHAERQPWTPSRCTRTTASRWRTLSSSQTSEVEASCQYMQYRRAPPLRQSRRRPGLHPIPSSAVPDARRVYTTFEQPDLKSTFTLTVKAPRAEGLSNAPTSPSRKRGLRLAPLPSPRSCRPITATSPPLRGHDGHGACTPALPSSANDADETIEITCQGFEFFRGCLRHAYPFTKYD